MADESELGERATAATKPERRRATPAVARAEAPAPKRVARVTVLPAGTHVGRYQIVRLVGEGGMGAVYEASDSRLCRKVALKVLSSSLKGKHKAAKRFTIEAQAAARLVHPNVVRVYDFDVACDVPYLAMEFLEGRTLAGAIAAGPLDGTRVADIMLGVCAGVYAAHQAGIVHRDLKPSNIFLSVDWDGREKARVLDFGISKVGGISSSDLTQTGDIVGTSQYLSPEQATGQRHVTERSDQYSLGVVMYECLTQRTPQQGLAMYDLLRAVAEGRYPRLAELRPDLPSTFAAIVARAMSLRPQERFSSVYELGQALFPFAGPESQRPFDDYYRGGPEPARLTPTRREGAAVLPAVSPAVTLREPATPVPAWQARATRTSSRRGRAHRPLAAQGARASSGSRAVAYSVAIGAVVAAVVLGALLLALRA
jgi:serine/threonine-protein kinase